jgi:hypothetical protein
MDTETLLLHRASGAAMAEDYVGWAVESLSSGLDSPSLRILAGLNLRFDQDEVEQYFVSSAAELGIQLLEPGVRNGALLIKRKYDRNEISAETAIEMLAKLYQASDYSDVLLAIWWDIAEELSHRGSGYEGVYYPPELLSSLTTVFEREWALFERASLLSVDPDFCHFVLCRCGYIGKPLMKRHSRFERILRRLRGKRFHYVYNVCPQCAAKELRSFQHPDVRERYFSTLETTNR